MSTLEELQRQYNHHSSFQSNKVREANTTRLILQELKNKFGTSFFTSLEIKEIFYSINKTSNKHLYFNWIQSQVKRKLLYRVTFSNRASMYRVVYVPDEGVVKLSNDMKREIQSLFNQIQNESSQGKAEVEQRRHEENKHLAYSLHKENQYLPIEEKPEITIPVSKNTSPELKSIEEVLLPSGMVDISTKAEANKRYDLRGDDKLTLSIKLTKNEEETFTFMVKDKTRIELLQKFISILEATK